MITDASVDIVYRWINPDTGASRQREILLLDPIIALGKSNCVQRTRDNGELRHSLRTVEKYAKWVRRIYILGEGLPPNWLSIEAPIFWIDLKSFLRENGQVPQLNSEVQKLLFAKIPGIAENFICFDDDWFLGSTVTKNDFYNHSGVPIQPVHDHAPIAWTKTLFSRGLDCLPRDFLEKIRTENTSRLDPFPLMRNELLKLGLIIVSSQRDAALFINNSNVDNYLETLAAIEVNKPQTYFINDDWSEEATKYREQIFRLQQFFFRMHPASAAWEKLS